MKSKFVIQQRLDEIESELKHYLKTQNFKAGQIDSLIDEGMQLRDQLDLHKKAQGMMSMASPAEHGFSNVNPGAYDGNGAFPGGQRYQPPRG